MKKVIFSVVMIVLGIAVINSAEAVTHEGEKIEVPCYILKAEKQTYPFHSTGFMGDYGDIKMKYGYMDGETSCLKVTYSAECQQGKGWAGVYWQYPDNNWGSKEICHDLSNAEKLTFWIRGDSGGEVIEEVKVGGIGKDQPHIKYPDSSCAAIGPLSLSSEWQQFTIPLEGDFSRIRGGFCFVVKGKPKTFYLRDICLE